MLGLALGLGVRDSVGLGFELGLPSYPWRTRVRGMPLESKLSCPDRVVRVRARVRVRVRVRARVRVWVRVRVRVS